MQFRFLETARYNAKQTYVMADSLSLLTFNYVQLHVWSCVTAPILKMGRGAVTMTTTTIEDCAESTANADFAYQNAVEEQRKQEAANAVENHQDAIDKDLRELHQETQQYKENKIEELHEDVTEVVDPELKPQLQGRVIKVEHDTETRRNTLTIQLRDGDTFSASLKTGTPENPSEWEYLCQYVGVSPLPSDLRGEIVPIKTPNDSDDPLLDAHIPSVFHETSGRRGPTIKRYNPTLHKPPALKRLNPLRYKLSRTIVEPLLHKKPATKLVECALFTAPWWFSALGFVVSLTLSINAINEVGIFSNTVLGLPAAFIGFIMYFTLGAYAIATWGKTLLFVLLFSILLLGSGLKKSYSALFPTE